MLNQYVFAQAQQYVLTDQHAIAEEPQYVLISNMHWLHQYATKVWNL